MIKEYTKKDGSKAYMFVAYLGVDPLTGKQKRTTRRGFKTKREAKIAEAKLQAEVNLNGFVSNENITFEEVYQTWYEQYKLTVRESTLNNVTIHFSTQILPKFGHLKMSDISSVYCQKVVNEWYQRLKSAKHYLMYTKTIFSYAFKMKIIKENPLNLVVTPRVEKEMVDPESLYYNKDELQTFLSYVKDDPFYHALFRVLAFTGIRRGELLALTWDDLDIENGTLAINKTVTYRKYSRPHIGPPKTKKSIRIISIDRPTIQLLQVWKMKQLELLFSFGNPPKKEGQLIFSSVRTNSIFEPSVIRQKMVSVTEKYGLKLIKIHGFRHTHCSLLFESGATVQEVQNRLGHSDIKTTVDIYAHVTQKQKDEMADRFAIYMNF